LQTLRFVNADPLMAPVIESSTELMAEGSRRYLAGDYKGAIPSYERALEIEELKQRLSPDMWRVLVDNLGMSFAFTGNPEAAEGVFRFGISKDPNYAMFHYNLACARAEKKDMAGAIEELRVAFRNRNLMIKGESIPDPAKDDSFAPFMSNTEFTRFLKELQ
jgi:tetratricopeptide (TPR) repeat protein